MTSEWGWIIGGLLVIALTWIGWQSRRWRVQPIMPTAEPDAPDAMRARELIAQNQRLAAIALIRKRTGMDLKQAKAWVDHAASDLASRAGALVPAVTEMLERKVQVLLSRNRYLEAIRLVRQQTGMDLAAAKMLVDTLRQRATSAPPRDSLMADGTLSPALAAEVALLLERSQPIPAAKLICERTGASLQAAKAAMDQLPSRRR